MQKLRWDDSYSVGIKKIDEQHKKIIDMVNALLESSTNEELLENTATILEEMSRYAEVHFRTEEQLMEQYGYPQRNKQINEHIQFRFNIVDLGTEAAEYGKSIPLGFVQDLARHLRNWWTNHILESDMAYKEFFSEKEIH